MNTAENPPLEFHCPGQRMGISRAVHLGRLASFFPLCRQCPAAKDSVELAGSKVRQWEELHARSGPRLEFGEESVDGVCHHSLGRAEVRRMALAFAELLREACDEPNVVLAGDGRPLTAELTASASAGLRWSGCSVVDIGPATAACMTSAIGQIAAAGGLLIGNSLGQPQTAGLKFWGESGPLSRGAELDAIEARAKREFDRPARRFGPLVHRNAVSPYLDKLRASYHGLRPLRFVLDTTCPPIAEHLARLTEATACRALNSLSRSREGNRSIEARRASEECAHLPTKATFLACASGLNSPGIAKGYLASEGESGDIAARIRAQQAHFGLQISDDGECCRLVDEQGHEVPWERLLLLIASGLALPQSAARPHQETSPAIVLEVGTPAALARQMEGFGLRVERSSPRRAEMNRAMRESAALLGGGPSGRLWYRVDELSLPDALWTATYLFVLLSRSDRPLSVVLDSLVSGTISKGS